MGGCVASCVLAANGAQEEKREIKALKELGAQSVEIGDVVAGESRIRRSPSMKDVTLEDIYTTFYGGEHRTLVRMLKANAEKYKTNVAM